LLNYMDQLVTQQTATFIRVRSEAPLVKYYAMTDSERLGVGGTSRTGGLSAGMNADRRKIVAQQWFEMGAGLFREWCTNVAQDCRSLGRGITKGLTLDRFFLTFVATSAGRATTTLSLDY
jgi:hypothetical protein